MATTESAGLADALLFEPCRFTAGFEKASTAPGLTPGPGAFVLSEEAFGHTGLGRSIGFADPAARLGFADVMNRHAHKAFPSERFQPVVDATYQALGYMSKPSSKWA
jgi:hypothetical protein